MARLGVNVESVAFLRKRTGGSEADPVSAALIAEIGGADGIVCTLSESLDIIKERDVRLLKEIVKTHLNINVPPVENTVRLALETLPDMITIIPGKKPGTSQGGGFDVLGQGGKIAKLIEDIRNQDIVVSLLVDPNIHQIKTAAKLGLDYVELHMGQLTSCEDLNERTDLLENIQSVALAASKLGLGVSAGRGINYQNVSLITEISSIEEINIGRAMIGRAILIGMEAAVRDMVALVH